MNCEEAAKTLDEYLDKELTKEQLAYIEAHLSKCKDCFGHVSFQKALRRTLKDNTLKEKLSSDIKHLIQEKLQG